MAGIKQIKQGLEIAFPQDKWLLKQLDSYLEGEFSAMEAGKFYPSALGNPCDRFLYFAYNGMITTRPIEAVLQRIFDNGSYLEERMDEYFTKIGILEDREVIAKWDNPVISGRADFLIKHEDDEKVIIELKSINSRGFTALKKSPKDEHLIQIQLYLNILDIDKGIVLYENKNDQKLKAFQVRKDTAIWESVLNRCFKIMEMTEAPEKCGGNKWCQCKNVTQTGHQ